MVHYTWHIKGLTGKTVKTNLSLNLNQKNESDKTG